MCVRVLSVSGMPKKVRIWVDDRDDGRFNVYIDESLIQDDGALALQQILNVTITGWQRLDETMVRTALRAVTG
ncbi:hypothetical protein S1361_06715 [Streptomyces cyanogenus]|uniref:Uncharacterized protein n=2 Tax=Streptomyces cyanogenus TaxID=80860 RepID=A0ABX7TN69_STRCY|nr:hypothetical protein S1361_06715 [Streptomyces cyanogenus]